MIRWSGRFVWGVRLWRGVGRCCRESVGIVLVNIVLCNRGEIVKGDEKGWDGIWG